MWFVPKVRVQLPDPTPGLSSPTPPYNIGRCRRHAPTMSGYPVVFVNDFCGDHKLDEENLYVEIEQPMEAR